MGEFVSTLIMVLLMLVLIVAAIIAMGRGGLGSGTRAGYFYRPKKSNLDHLTDTEFFEPRQAPDVEYGLGPDPYDPEHRKGNKR